MKILVIGAGPAGLSAALNASRNGNEVLIFEKNNRLSSKVCGEALAREALDYVDMRPSKKFIINEVKGFQVAFKGKFSKEVAFGNLANFPGYLIDKRSFLELLVNEAGKEGVKVFFNATVEKIEPKSGKLRLQNGEVVQGDFIICADGYGSVARCHLDYSNYDTGIGVQCKCSLPEGLDPKYLHLNIIGDGYTWIFIKRDWANIGMGLPANSHSPECITAHLNKYVKKLGVKQLSKIVSAPVSIGGPLKDFGTGKMVVAGEAAGCVMPLTGEGIRFGIFSGRIACKPEYRNHFMREYGRKMETSRRTLQMVRNLNDNERIDLFKYIENPLEVLDGKLPRIRNFFLKPRLFLKVMHNYLLR